MKTDEQRIEQLMEMQEHPERFTEEQIRQALALDPELKAMMEQLAFAKRALKYEETQVANPSVDKEWEKFAAAHTKQPRILPFKRLSKIAAIFIGVIFFPEQLSQPCVIQRLTVNSKQRTTLMPQT